MFTFVTHFLVFFLGIYLGGYGVMHFLVKRYHCTKIPRL